MSRLFLCKICAHMGVKALVVNKGNLRKAERLTVREVYEGMRWIVFGNR
jgi:hypothetical protein